MGEYAVPNVSYCVASRTINVDDSSVDARETFIRSDEDNLERNCEENLKAIKELPESNNKFITEEHSTDEMNGNSAAEDGVDGVKELAASFQHVIHEETAKAKGRPPPVKPKSYKKAPPPIVAPKPKANGVLKVNKTDHSPTG